MNDDWLWDGGVPDDDADARVAAALAGLRRARECPPLPDRPKVHAEVVTTEESSSDGTTNAVEGNTTADPSRDAAPTKGVGLTKSREGTTDQPPRDATKNAAEGITTVDTSSLTRAKDVDSRPTNVVSLVRTNRRTVGWAGTLALAAAALLAVFLPRESAWEVSVLAGASPCGAARCTLSGGGSVETSSDGRLAVTVGRIGTINLGPDTRLARIPAADGHVLDLDAGTIEVAVIAPPRDLRIQTPAAWVVDLGCAYRLSVDDAGTHLLVEDGSVSLENQLGISVVTAGSAAVVQPGSRPQLPLRTDAPEAFATALRGVEATIPAVDDSQLTTLLALARRQDLLTLWHVVQLIPTQQRPGVVETMANLAPAVAVDRAAVQRLDPDALIALWGDLVPVALAP